MDLRAIIDDIASRADDFLAGASNRNEARAGIAELITLDYTKLAPPDRAHVTDSVMKILNEEGFFEHDPGEFSAENDKPADLE